MRRSENPNNWAESLLPTLYEFYRLFQQAPLSLNGPNAHWCLMCIEHTPGEHLQFGFVWEEPSSSTQTSPQHQHKQAKTIGLVTCKAHSVPK